jgi:glycosyltransferase involved in cell wall biosynthesis
VSDLLVTSHTPVLRSGRAMRTYTIARALAGEDGLDLLYVRFEGHEPDEAFASIPGVRMHAVVSSRGARRLRTYAAARLRGLPATVARSISPELARAAAELARTPGRGRIVADGPIVAETLAALSRQLPVIYNAHNFESGFRTELNLPGTGTLRANRAFERRILERASEAWMVSERDIEGARELCPTVHMRLVPNVVDVSSIQPTDGSPDGRRAIFVASFAYAPNQTGLRFMLEQVMPRVWSELPDARLRLVGSGLQRPPSEDPRVETLGFVEDLRTAYASAACAVVPLLQGGGTPLKFIEALAHGLPVIATPGAAAGLEVIDGEHCLIADGAEAFAAGLVKVLREGAPELARHGRELAERRYSIEALQLSLR